MKRIKSTILYGLLAASSGVLCTSCADKLDLSRLITTGVVHIGKQKHT